ncbi:hypothetical protein KSD_16160 [Ktedonobacter sp. SOSP1-85]|uniref:hypothetical protein n=1 Tax=Ktedonobacter sp. SOSP1-85 TaxID=2778367 RepID=UPI001A3460B9|nr:hypothetical protein [Ktedonobacter sp. SOSP1-85]GHO73845.1 hypothetical protein KSD_16160 [Ktedonobacter sp. SOSP1-85]
MHCHIYVKGHLDPSWQEWLGGLTILHDDATGTTLLTGTLLDQAALHGVLGTLRRLNLSLLSLETDEIPQAEESPFSSLDFVHLEEKKQT